MLNYSGKYDLIRMNAQDLVRKGLIPDYSKEYTNTNHSLAQAANETKAFSRGYRCKSCGIEIHSKVLMKEHVKTHFKGEKRENEIDIVRVNPY